MAPKENGETREEHRETESDCEPGRNSFSSQGDTQSNEEQKVRRASRVPKNLRKETAESNVRPRRVSSDGHESNKLQFKTSNNSRNKSQKSDRTFTASKGLTELHTENVKVSAKASSESSEGADERINEDNSVEEFKEIDLMDEAPNCDRSVGTDNETIETEENSFGGDKVNIYQKIEEMASKIEKLEEELREVAALEISLYSVVPEHGSSAHKLHTPARRLSRLYFHACKHGTQQQKASVAKNTVSGLVLIAKSCGNDVARLTFWLSNMVVFREIISQAFGISSSTLQTRMSAESNGVANKSEGKLSSQNWKTRQGSRPMAKPVLFKLVDDWKETKTFTSALERIESWMFSRIVESVWWQTLTPHMQSPSEDSYKRRGAGKLLGPALGDQQQGNFSIGLWKGAFLDAFTRLCPLRAGGHGCGCLPVLPEMVMIQCFSRLDVAMFNAILRESANEIPTDPVSDPILDARVLPILAGDLSFGSGAQLKNSIGTWSRWLMDLCGMDLDDVTKDAQNNNEDDDRSGGDIESKCFPLLNSFSDLLMLPKDMLIDKSIRMEVCPSIGLPLITRILCNFTPDEFCPDPVPGIVLEELNSERLLDRPLSDKDTTAIFPYAAAPVIYRAPTVADVAKKVADVNDGKVELGRNASIIQRRGYTSDEDLDDLDSPLASIIDKTSPVSPANGNGKLRESSSYINVRYKLLREVWSM